MFDRAVRSKLRGVNGNGRRQPERYKPATRRPGQARSQRSQRPNGARRAPDVVVFGQIARDLVLVVDTMPGARQAADVYQRRELLGGKGANQAVALAQLGMRPALAGVVGEDQIAQRLLSQAQHDQVDTSAVLRRPGVRTALIVDIVDSSGQPGAFAGRAGRRRYR